MSRAARRLNVGQPTLSRVVKVIEEKAGSPVLRRGRYGVTPTVIGEKLAAQGREIAERTERANEDVNNWKQGLTGEVRFGVGPMLAATIMGRFFEQALKRNWPYSIQITSEYAARAIDALNEGTLDAAILPSRLDLHQENLRQEFLFKDQLAVFAGAKSKIAQADRPYSLADLAGLPWVETAAVSGLHGSTREILSHHGFEAEPRNLKFRGDVFMALQVVSNTDALCVLPRRQLALFPQADRLKPIAVDIPLPPRDIAFWTAKTTQDAPAVLHLHSKLKAHLVSIGLD